MLNNLVNRHDLSTLVERGPVLGLRILGRMFSSSRARTLETWRHTTRPPSAWNDVAAVRARWNERVSGDRNIDFMHHVLGRHFGGRDGLRALSLGCGSGANELRWAGTGRLAHLDAWDLSPARIAHAREQARVAGLDAVLEFHAGDVLKMPPARATYDLVIAQGSLHHFSPLELVLAHVEDSLAPGGLFLVEDFVGPTRFQWSARQIEAVNALLDLLPAAMRTLSVAPGRPAQTKRPVFVPSRLRMMLADPSEAVESGRILQLLPRHFDLIELRPIGGAILHLLLNGIAHNFLLEDDASRRWLQLCFEVEDLLMASGELQSDFAAAVCARRPARPAGTPSGGAARHHVR